MGHLNPMLNIARELRARGHKVSLATCKFLAGKVEKSCQDAGIDFIGIAEGVQSSETPGSPANLAKDTSILALYAYYNLSMLASLTAAARHIQPDVLLTDFLTTCGYEAGAEVGITVAVNFADPVLIGMLGPSPSSLLPAVMSVVAPFAMGNNLSDAPFLHKAFRYSREAIYKKLCFVNSFWGLEKVRPMPPNVIFTGPTGQLSSEALDETSMKSLNEWLVWVRREGLKVVYVTFGTMVQLSSAQIQSLYEGLAAVPGIAVAWSLKEEGQKSLPVLLDKKFFVYHWFPQAEVLRLKDVGAVITHCGFGGLMEIIAGGKPLIGMPFVGDQFANAKAAKAAGLGECLLGSKITKAAVEALVSKVVQSDGYAVSAARMQAAIMTSGSSTLIATQIECLAKHGVGHMTRNTPTYFARMAWCCS
ncbi:unnamed protein product [Polarella glacialis]|uniref:Glycosyltransferase n=1 Tax=Polarella glacialis TaxID=89957 RepID=A0A813F1I1_POLGL|nr:unnamed protein product [Polarella glacialis]